MDHDGSICVMVLDIDGTFDSVFRSFMVEKRLEAYNGKTIMASEGLYEQQKTGSSL